MLAYENEELELMLRRYGICEILNRIRGYCRRRVHASSMSEMFNGKRDYISPAREQYFNRAALMIEGVRTTLKAEEPAPDYHTPDQESDKIPAESFCQTLASNVDNSKLNDADFRELVRNSLPIVANIGS